MFLTLNVCQSVRPGNSHYSSLMAKKLQTYGDCPIFDNFRRDFQQLLWLSEQTEEPAIQNTCSLCTDTQLQFTATNVKSKGLTVPRKCPIIHGDWKSMHYSTNFVRVCGGCTLIHAPAPGST